MIASGSATLFVLYDVAHSIDLERARSAIGPGVSAATLSRRNPGTPRLTYQQPPLIVDGAAFGAQDAGGFRVRVKLFDYGVISVMLTKPFTGSWSELVSISRHLIASDGPGREAARICDEVMARARPGLNAPRDAMLSEDYAVVSVTAFDLPQSADALVEHHGGDIAQALRGEHEALSWQEVEEVLRHRLSYFASDLVVPAWNAAFVFDNEAGVQSTLEIVEFVNSQLLEFRYYDQLLEGELARIYAELQSPKWTDRFLGRRHTGATQRLHTLFIDVNELTDHMENAIKIVGDVYEARLVGLIGSRVGVPDWKASVREKLKTLDDIHRFAVEQTTASRATLLEATVVLILVVELVLLLAGLRG